jgi:hypothetical protein
VLPPGERLARARAEDLLIRQRQRTAGAARAAQLRDAEELRRREAVEEEAERARLRRGSVFGDDDEAERGARLRAWEAARARSWDTGDDAGVRAVPVAAENPEVYVEYRQKQQKQQKQQRQQPQQPWQGRAHHMQTARLAPAVGRRLLLESEDAEVCYGSTPCLA